MESTQKRVRIKNMNGWETYKLKELFIFKNGKRPKIYPKGSVPIYGANGLMGYTNKHLIEADKILLIGRVGASGEVHLAKGKIWVSDNAIYGRVVDKNKVDILFMFYFLKSKNLSRLATRSTHPIINQRILNNLTIPLPPLPEQRKIAEILSTVDEAIEVTDREIEKAERLKRGLMQDLLTKGIGHTRFKKTELGTIPEEWEVVRLGKVIERPQYGLTAKATDIYTGTKFLRITDIQNGSVNWDSVPYCLTSKEDQFRLRTGDILIARIGATTGKAFLVKKCPKAIFASYLIRIRTKTNLLAEYLIQFMKSSMYWRQINSLKGGRLKEGINIPQLLNLKLPLPSLSEQKKIAEILSSADDFIERLKARREKLVKLKQGLMEDLLTGKRRVKL